MHEHDECEHDLRLCRHCDIVYCKRCRREWGRHAHYTPYIPYAPWYWEWIQPYWTGTNGTSTMKFNAASQTDASNMLAQTEHSCSTQV